MNQKYTYNVSVKYYCTLRAAGLQR